MELVLLAVLVGQALVVLGAVSHFGRNYWYMQWAYTYEVATIIFFGYLEFKMPGFSLELASLAVLSLAIMRYVLRPRMTVILFSAE